MIVHARTREPVRTVRYGHRRQSCTLKNERACPNHQKETPASMMVPLKTNVRVTVLKNHAGGHHLFRTQPNMACKRRCWRGPKPGAFFMRGACRRVSRFTRPPAAQLKPSVGPPSPRNTHAGQPDRCAHRTTAASKKLVPQRIDAAQCGAATDYSETPAC